MTEQYLWLTVAVIALVTAAIRFLPFLVFKNGRAAPKLVVKLGRLLPFAVMGMLVVYCLKDVNFLAAPFGLPEILSCAVVAILHIWKRNSLLSIGLGTVCYMLLVQFVF